MITLFLLSGGDCAWSTGTDTLVVIVNPQSDLASLNRSDVVNIFMGRFKKLPSGERAIPLDTENHKEQFYGSLVNKTLAEINAYWARLTFSGQTASPQAVTESRAIEIVAATPGAIAYVDKRLLDKRVKPVLELPR